MKLVKEHIVLEKFTEDSDPIHDMDIGIKHKIKEWLEEYDIIDYTINDDLTINASCVKLQNNNIEKLPDYIQFNFVKGYFSIEDNRLTTLRGCPFYIFEDKTNGWFGNFWCERNRLKSLKYAPKMVEGNFGCNGNLKAFTKKNVLEVCEVRRNIYTDFLK
jgi:hypothetical protein